MMILSELKKQAALDLSIFTRQKAGPSCSKLAMSLVNDSLKFTSSDMQIQYVEIFC